MRTLVVAVSAALLIAAAPADAKTFKQADSGSSVTVKKGKRFKVRLEQASDGGYEWKVAKPAKARVLKLVRTRTLPGSCAGDPYCIGGTTTFVATYKAVGRGRAKVRLVHQRSFSGETIGRFKLDVTVK
jgi:predicted secreted protein